MQHVKVMIQAVEAIQHSQINRMLYVLDTQIDNFILGVLDKKSEHPDLLLLYTPKARLLETGENEVDMFDSCVQVFPTEEAAIMKGNQLKIKKGLNIDTIVLYQITRHRASDGYVICKHHKTI